ncbi:MAG: class I SAM-dependent methyltransferase [Bacteroidota bacterium]
MSPCLYCEKDDSILLYETVDIYDEQYAVRSCNHCRAIFISPRPSAKVLERVYDTAYYGNRADKFDSWIEKPLEYFRSRRARVVTKYLKAPAKVLDVGCGNGHFLSHVQRQGDFEIYGIEMAGRAAERAAQIPNIHLKKGTLAADDFSPNSLDAITLFHVFEHLSEPRQTLDIIDNLLKPNGILSISFPNIDSWQSQLFKGDWLHLDPPRHLFFIKPKDFKKEMERRGYVCLEENYFSIEYNPYGYSQSVLNKLTKKRDVLYEQLKGNAQYTQSYSSLSLLAQKLFFIGSTPFFILLDALEALLKKSGTVEFVFRKK